MSIEPSGWRYILAKMKVHQSSRREVGPLVDIIPRHWSPRTGGLFAQRIEVGGGGCGRRTRCKWSGAHRALGLGADTGVLLVVSRDGALLYFVDRIGLPRGGTPAVGHRLPRVPSAVATRSARGGCPDGVERLFRAPSRDEDRE